MDEKELKEVEELLTGIEKDLEEGKIEDAKAKVATAKSKLPGTGSNGFPQTHK